MAPLDLETHASSGAAGDESDQRLRITREEVEAYARYSGDANPLHTDAGFARRSAWGRPIVFGMLAAVRCLVAAPLRGPIVEIEVAFREPVFTDVEYRVKSWPVGGRWICELRDGETTLLRVRVRELEGSDLGNHARPEDSGTGGELELPREPSEGRRSTAVDRSADALAPGLTVEGRYLDASAGPRARLEPPTEPGPDEGLAHGLGLCSYVSGMLLPGRRGLLSTACLRVDLRFPWSEGLDFRALTRHVGAEFGLASVELVAGMRDRVAMRASFEAFVLDPVAPTTVAAVRASGVTRRADVAGEVALVTGATRGLGAAIAQVLALGGRHVIVNGRTEADATALLEALEAAGASVELALGDAADPQWAQRIRDRVDARWGRLDLLVLNACPPPVALPPGSAGAERRATYIADALALARVPLAALGPTLAASEGVLAAVSSAFVDAPPPRLAHYAQCKRQTEALVEQHLRDHPRTRGLILRPPTLRTDMTNTPLVRARTRSPLEVALALALEVPDARCGTPHRVSLPAKTDAALPVTIVANFTARDIERSVTHWGRRLGVPLDVQFAPYDQVFQQLLDPSSQLRRSAGPAFLLVRTQRWWGAAGEAGARRSGSEFVSAVREAAAGRGAAIVVLLCPAGLAAPEPERAALAELEATWVEALRAIPGVDALRVAELHASYGFDQEDDQQREALGDIPYSPAYFDLLGTLACRRYSAATRPSAKVVVLDCDGTLWAGACAERGSAGVGLDESFLAVQRFARASTARGVLLCLASKNTEADVWSVFDEREDMVLRRSDIVAHRIDWRPKSVNIRALAEELGLGLDSFVFVDDNPVECAEVRAACPEVLVLCTAEFEAEPAQMLAHLWSLDRSVITDTDRQRTQLYRSERERRELLRGSDSLATFLAKLELEVEVAPVNLDNLDNLERISQLTLRTNQFNTTTRRLDAAQLRARVADGKHRCRAVRVRDRFGDYGWTGAVFERDLGEVTRVELLLSCRVLGRGVEARVLGDIAARAQDRGARELRFPFCPTARNEPARALLVSVAGEPRDEEGVLWFTITPTALEAAIAAGRAAPGRTEEVGSRPTSESPAPVQARGDWLAIARESYDRGALLRTFPGPRQRAPKIGLAHSGERRDLAALVRDAFARHLWIEPAQLVLDTPLERLGLDSHTIVSITAELARALPNVPPTLLFEHRSIAQIVAALTDAPDADPRQPGATTSGHAPARTDDVAIIGMSGRYSGAPSLAALWTRLAAGDVTIGEAPAGRWGPLATLPGLAEIRAGFLDEVDRFDAAFFRIAPAEAEMMDPQQRLLLEVAWEALEDAAITRARLGRDVGVFVGIISNDYALYTSTLAALGQPGYRSADHYQAANRISYALDLRGPSLAIDTACSSSGTAIHMACAAIQRGECEAALVGGVNLILHPSRLVQYTRMQLLSPSGRCTPFGSEADGAVLGEGVGALLLKPLARARADGDPIRAVIRGTAINSGGRTSGFTVPDPTAQADVVARALASAGVGAETVGYVEAHGTGTPLGDPIEIRGLSLGFDRAADDDTRPACALGSIKANIGHTESGAAIAGVIKVLLQFERGQLVPSPGAGTLNPAAEIDTSRFYVPSRVEPWRGQPRGDGGRWPLRAGVSSFGAGGANFHAVLEAPPVERSAARPGPVVVPFSAGDASRLRSELERLAEWIDDRCDARAGLAEIAYTLQLGREPRRWRWACVVESVDALRESLRRALAVGSVGSDARRASDALRVLGEDGELDALVDKWARAGKHERIASLWVQGFDADWGRLWSGPAPQRIHLPPRAFVGDRHWFDRDAFAEVVGATSVRTGHPPQTEVARPVNTSHSAPTASPVDRLRELFAAVTKLPLARVAADDPIENFGLDSLMIEELNGRIIEAFGVDDPTALFRCRSLAELGEQIARRSPSTPAADTSEPAARVLPPQPPVRTSPPRATAARASERRPSAAPGQTVDIAIIGIATRLPGAPERAQLWANLVAGRDSIVEIPRERWSLEGFYEPDRDTAVAEGRSYSKWGGFLDDIDCFDPLLFNISPRDAVWMDPQERLFLESAWACLEDAGYCRSTIAASDRVGVFAGSTYNNYQLLMADAAVDSHYLAFSQSYSIANRVSFAFGLTGPSFTVDAACASSLYAVHLACESIYSGSSRMALAGGVNLSLHPSKYIMISNRGFHSADGRCRAFRAGGSGYVPSEGIGVVLLKRLEDAERDGDHIYGVIKGTALTHGGRTNGYSVPNPSAQAEAIREAHRAAGVDPRSISFVEAHGTGTRLGDPIEIAGLTEAFAAGEGEGKGKGKGYCAISSIKSNIGHAEGAAGMAQIAKVLLQFEHGQLVPNVAHGDGPNPEIEFASTPFVVQERLAPWRRPIIDGVEQPRRAGVSSFGAGGANAHLVLEEYRPRPRTPAASSLPMPIVLSARTADQLVAQARRLSAALEERPDGRDTLVDVAFTLAVGREPLAERLGFVVDDLAALRRGLSSVIAGTLEPGMVRARSKTRARTCADHAELAELVAAWVGGERVEWRAYFEGLGARRTPLPSYPFARDRYWFRAPGRVTRPEVGADDSGSLHGANTSDLRAQRFSLELRGDESFLRDHQIGGAPVLPAVAYLEFVRDAAVRSVPGSGDGFGELRIGQVVWLAPLVVSTPLEVDLCLHPRSETELEFEVRVGDTLHCQGRVWLGAYPRPRPIDVAVVRGRTRDRLGPDPIYGRFAAADIEYGATHRRIASLWRDGHGELLAELQPGPDTLASTSLLEPGLFDAALQASVHLRDDGRPPGLPFTLASLEIHAELRTARYAHVHESGAGVTIGLYDAEGLALASLAGFVARTPVVRQAAAHRGTRSPPDAIQPYRVHAPTWEQSELTECAEAPAAVSTVLACGVRGPSGAELVDIEGLPIDQAYERCANRLLAILQASFEAGRGQRLAVQVIYPWVGERRCLEGLAGMLRTARMENPNLEWQVLGLSEAELARIDEVSRANAAGGLSVSVRYERGVRYVRGWRCVALDGRADDPWRDGACYLFIGGRGGVARLFVEDLARRGKRATLVLASRSEPSADERLALGAAAGDALTLVHARVDVGDPGSLHGCIERARGLGDLRGVIHAAGVLRDAYLRDKTTTELEAVFRPKVSGTRNLIDALAQVPLDFLALFSSTSGSLGNPGQADYSAANAFQDAAALYLADALPRTRSLVSIDWALWADGGMQVDAAVVESMSATLGLRPMSTATGMAAADRVLGRGGQLMVLVGDQERLDRQLEAPRQGPRAPVGEVDGAALERAVMDRVAAVIGVSIEELDADGDFAEYGFDSISLTELSNRVNADWDLSVSPAVFFEYLTPREFADYLRRAHAAELSASGI